MSRSIFFIFLMRFLQTTVDAAIPNYRLNCNGQILRGTIQSETVITGEVTLLAFPGDLCTASDKELLNDESRYYICDDCLNRCESTVIRSPKSLFIISDVKAPNSKLSWFQLQNPIVPIKGFNEIQCNLQADPVGASSSMEETSTDALRSFSKTSVLFVSISFIILMVISLAWLVFYYVQRFRYAHAKDRLQRRLFNAARKALTKIPTRSVRQGDDELQTDCAVCLDPYQLHDIVRILPCKHLYHKSCIDPWLLEHRTCPMCKADILKYFGYNYFETHLERPDDMVGRVELGERERDRSILPNEIEVPSESSESNGFSFDHSENVENFAFTPTVPPQLVLNASNAKSFVMPMSGRVGSVSSVVGTSSSGSSSHHPTSYSARSHRSASHDTPTPQRVIRTSMGTSSTSSGSQGQIVNLVQVKSRASSASVTRAATIRKESIPQPTPIDVSSERPATTSTNTQVV